MTGTKSVKDVLGLTITTYSAFGHDYTETQLVLRVDPAIVIQMLAWNGVAYLPDGTTIHVADWKGLPPEIIREIKWTLFTSYRSILSGRCKPDADGNYELVGVATTARVEHQGIRVPDHKEVLKHRTNVKVRRVI